MTIMNQEKIDHLADEIGKENVPVLLEIFLGELKMYIDNLGDDGVDNPSYLKEISHALKSSAASFGAEALCQLAIEMDARAKTGELLDKESDVETMVVLLKDTQEQYQRLVVQ